MLTFTVLTEKSQVHRYIRFDCLWTRRYKDGILNYREPMLQTTYYAATLSSSKPWNISRVTCIFSNDLHEPLGECCYKENSSDTEWDFLCNTTRERCSTILYRHRKYIGQLNQFHAAYDGKVGCNSVENTTAFHVLIGGIFYGMIQSFMSQFVSVVNFARDLCLDQEC